jgi:hypothetical protein
MGGEGCEKARATFKIEHLHAALLGSDDKLAGLFCG